MRLTCDHGLPADWLIWVQDVQQMQELNRSPRRELPHRAEVVDVTTLESNTLSALGRSPVGGQIIYQPPVDLTGATARTVYNPEEPGLSALQLDMGVRVFVQVEIGGSDGVAVCHDDGAFHAWCVPVFSGPQEP